MSELTRCNRCTLTALQRRYGEDNVRTQYVSEGDMKGWIRAEVREGPDRPWQRAGHYFLQLTETCVC